MTSKRMPREGSLLRISLDDGVYAFARVLPNLQVAVYDYRSSEAEPSHEGIFGSKVLWTLTVMKTALTSGRWALVGHRPLEAKLLAPVEYCIRDRLTGQYSIYRSSDGSSRASNFEECSELEMAAAWEAEHVEDRLRDHFAGRPNIWAQQLKPVP